MLECILPYDINNALKNIDFNSINEIRLRVNKPVMVCVNGKFFLLNSYGLTNNLESAIICDSAYIKYVINKVSNDSFYSVNDQIICGYISYKGGIRIGVAGEIVFENNSVRTIKNINSLNIRIPHQIKNCSLNYFGYLVKGDTVFSTLVISKPGAGKTTFIRDLVTQISKRTCNNNILVVDERGEISGQNQLDLGNNVDVYTNCDKSFGFECGIRSLNPSVVVTDEINFNKDLDIIERALTSGVKVVATMHANGVEDIKLKKDFKEILNKQLFDRYLFLNSDCGPGTVEGIYNSSLGCIYC